MKGFGNREKKLKKKYEKQNTRSFYGRNRVFSDTTTSPQPSLALPPLCASEVISPLSEVLEGFVGISLIIILPL